MARSQGLTFPEREQTNGLMIKRRYAVRQRPSSLTDLNHPKIKQGLFDCAGWLKECRWQLSWQPPG
jgi:hypothetical protein